MTFVDAFVFLYTYSDMYTPAVTNCRNVMASFIYFGHVPDLAGRALEKLYLVRTHTISHKHIERHSLLKINPVGLLVYNTTLSFPILCLIHLDGEWI